ncbi:hypothetical protein Bca52824_041528 [Brassica carinata]|nr:hypothetical protein Bca52824_041528 [Brassica carinata]
MTQYTSCADPSESAARKERLRQAEQNGQLEESVALMARASLGNLPKRNLDVTQHASPERIPALLRLGSPNSPRISPEPDLPDSPQRTPALLRFGKHLSPSREQATSKRKPGRPPGTKKISNGPKIVAGTGARKRKVQQAKPPKCRRKLPAPTE